MAKFIACVLAVVVLSLGCGQASEPARAANWVPNPLPRAVSDAQTEKFWAPLRNDFAWGWQVGFRQGIESQVRDYETRWSWSGKFAAHWRAGEMVWRAMHGSLTWQDSPALARHLRKRHLRARVKTILPDAP